MDIYELVFGTPLGSQHKVHCCFHSENEASAYISPEGMYHCFGCNASAHDETTFIYKYFNLTSMKEANDIKYKLSCIQKKYTPNTTDVTDEQRKYLNSIGIIDPIIDKYFRRKKSDNSLISWRTWNGAFVGYTVFNNPILSTYNASFEKYKYSPNTIAGSCSPADIVDTKNAIIITEGEKDCFVLMSQGHKASVSKLGGANSNILAYQGFKDKTIAIIYDCDDAGRQGAIKDAVTLMNKCNCKVRVIDLGLGDKEDLTDYFMKYNHTLQDLYKLINNTSYFIIPPEYLETPAQKMYKECIKLSYNDLIELRDKLTTRINNYTFNNTDSNNTEKVYEESIDIYTEKI